MNKLRSFLILAVVLGVLITGLQIFYIIRSWTTGEALDVSAYLAPIPSTLNISIVTDIEGREQNMPYKEL